MKSEKELIDKIESDALKEEAFFLFHIGDDDQDNEHIEANSHGLKLFASFLLRIAYNLTPEDPPHREDEFPIDQSFLVEGRGWIVNYVRFNDVLKSQIEKTNENREESFWDKLIPIGCIGLFVILIICSIIGLITVVNWLL